MMGNHGSDGPGDALRLWAERFNTKDPARIVPLYADDALLFGTSQAALYCGKDQIRSYFTGAATVKLGEHTEVPLGDDTVLSVGMYVFTQIRDGQRVATPARFTFVLKRRDGLWQILHHHSSAQPT
jgi:uncharacterized protein (TIGR02246 family)